MTRTLTLTAAEWEVLQRDGTAWIVRSGARPCLNPHKEPHTHPPAELVAAAAPCETCRGSRGGVAAASSGYMKGGRIRYGGAGGMSLTPVDCWDCRITLIDGYDYHCGYAYADSAVLPIVATFTWATMPEWVLLVDDGRVELWGKGDNEAHDWADLTEQFAHHGNLATLVGSYALKVRLT